MKVLLDTNVVLDLVLNRAPWQSDAAAIWNANLQGVLEACVTASQLTDVFYLVRRATGEAAARQSIQQCLSSLTILAVDFKVVNRAFQLGATDFEDAVQLAAADGAGVTALVTRDPSGFAGAGLPVHSPAALVAQLSAPKTEDEDE